MVKVFLDWQDESFVFKLTFSLLEAAQPLVLQSVNSAEKFQERFLPLLFWKYCISLSP